MDAGNQAREKASNDAVLALGAATRILLHRKNKAVGPIPAYIMRKPQLLSIR